MQLDVPFYKNFNNDSCFVTAVAMVLRYYGTRINQRKVFRKAEVFNPKNKKESWGCTVPSIAFAIKETGYKMLAWHDINRSDVRKGGKETEIFFDLWEDQINKAEKQGILESKVNGKLALINSFLRKGIPVIVGIKSKSFYEENRYWKDSVYNRTGGDDVNHVIVVTGYSNGYYTYNDSSPFLPNRRGQGMRVTEARLRTAWRAASYVKNAIFVLQKRST